ncbi:TPA: hypothetical protein DEA21_05690 [Candidatus Uhrbacteria bacterium]|nr:hypothetical protein [Candidatus Uhrbacteria bacterium]
MVLIPVGSIASPVFTSTTTRSLESSVTVTPHIGRGPQSITSTEGALEACEGDTEIVCALSEAWVFERLDFGRDLWVVRNLRQTEARQHPVDTAPGVLSITAQAHEVAAREVGDITESAAVPRIAGQSVDLVCVEPGLTQGEKTRIVFHHKNSVVVWLQIYIKKPTVGQTNYKPTTNRLQSDYNHTTPKSALVANASKHAKEAGYLNFLDDKAEAVVRSKKQEKNVSKNRPPAEAEGLEVAHD